MKAAASGAAQIPGFLRSFVKISCQLKKKVLGMEMEGKFGRSTRWKKGNFGEFSSRWSCPSFEPPCLHGPGVHPRNSTRVYTILVCKPPLLSIKSISLRFPYVCDLHRTLSPLR